VKNCLGRRGSGGVLRSPNSQRCRAGPRATPHRSLVTRPTHKEVPLAVLSLCSLFPLESGRVHFDLLHQTERAGFEFPRKPRGKQGSHGRVAQNPAQFRPKLLPKVSFRYQWRGTNCQRRCGGGWPRSLPKCSPPYTPFSAAHLGSHDPLPCLQRAPEAQIGGPEAGSGHQEAATGRERPVGGETVTGRSLDRAPNSSAVVSRWTSAVCPACR